MGIGWPHTRNRGKAAVEETQQDFRRSCSLRKSQDVKAKGYRFKEEAEQIGMWIPRPRVGGRLVRRETSLDIRVWESFDIQKRSSFCEQLAKKGDLSSIWGEMGCPGLPTGILWEVGSSHTDELRPW